MKIGCVYIPHYPAWAFLRHEGEGPLAVSAQGQVVAADSTARSANVEQGMSIGRARTLCEQLNVYPRDHALEKAEWERVEERLNTTTPYVECDVPGRAFINPHDVSGLEDVIEKLGACAAQAPTRLDAHLAALKATTGRLLKISGKHLDAFRRDVPVESLSAVGTKEDIPERLKLFGYDSVASVTTLSERHLRAQFGEDGEELYARLQVSDEPSVSAYTPPPSIEREVRYDHPKSEPGPLGQTIVSLTKEAASKLEGRTAQRLTLRLLSRTNGQIVESRTLREAQSAEHALCSVAETLLDNCLTREVAIEEVKVILGALASPDARQGKLFFERPATRKAIEAVHRKYPGALQRAALNRNAVFEEDRICYEPAS